MALASVCKPHNRDIICAISRECAAFASRIALAECAIFKLLRVMGCMGAWLKSGDPRAGRSRLFVAVTGAVCLLLGGGDAAQAGRRYSEGVKTLEKQQKEPDQHLVYF